MSRAARRVADDIGEEHSRAPQVVVPRRGVFTVHDGGKAVTADPMTVVVLHGRYRVSHPADGGDRCTVLALTPEVHEEALSEPHRTGHTLPHRRSPARRRPS